MARVRPPTLLGPSSFHVARAAPGAAEIVGFVDPIADENVVIRLAASIAARYQAVSSAVAPCGSLISRKYLVAASGSPSKSCDCRCRFCKFTRGWRRGFPADEISHAVPIVIATAEKITVNLLSIIYAPRNPAL